MVRIKKLLVLLTLAVGFFCFSTAAQAQAIDVCNSCKGGDVVGTVGCPQEGQESCISYPFGYQTRFGYLYTDTLTFEETPYRAIFNVCNCTNAGTTFVAGHRIGVRMTILVNGLTGENGAYWAGGPDSDVIRFGRFAQPADTCGASAAASLTDRFGHGKYFASDGTTPKMALVGTGCTVPSAYRATVLITNQDEGYTITPDDVLNKLSRWWIVIPMIKLDTSVLHDGEMISVKIETLDQNTGGICAACVATCECTIEVARVCPPRTMGSFCRFPYFTSTTSATPDQPWWNGIAIVNTSSQAGTATLSVFQQDGKTGTYTTPQIPAKSMYVKPLDQIPFTGSGLGGLPLYLEVASTFPALDGFAIIANTDTGESMGYLCRKFTFLLEEGPN